MTKYRTDNLIEMLAINKALADENRIRIILMLRQRSLCVCQITELLRLAPSTTSKHIAILKQVGLVDSRKEGRWIHCCIPSEGLSTRAEESIRLLVENLRSDARVIEDRKRLREILKIDKEALCRRM